MKEFFKIYEEKEYGYEFSSQIYDINDMFSYLDYILYEIKPNTRVLVIRRDLDYDCDEPYFLYKGFMVNTYTEYENFKRRELEKRRLEDIQHGKIN